MISQITFYTFHFHFYLCDFSDNLLHFFIFTFTFLTKIYHIKGVRSCHSSVSAHCPVTTKPTMPQSGLKQRLGRKVMLEKNADVNCCFLCSVIFIEYYSTMHCNEVLQACQVDPIYCDIFGAAERVLRYGLPINLRYIFKRVPALVYKCHKESWQTLNPC